MKFNITSNEIVPIRYMVGTGGVFLSSILTAAKNKEKVVMQLSPHGNCHNRSHDFFSFVHPTAGLGPNSPDEPKISALHSIHAATCEPPYFVHSHVKDLGFLLKNFPKTISIGYQIEDLEVLGTIVVYKFGIDVYQRFDSDRIQHFWSTCLLNSMDMFNQEMDGNHVVQFRDLLFSDMHILLNRLSEITGYPPEDFDIDFINEWRTKTLSLRPRPPLPILDILKNKSFNEANTRPVSLLTLGGGYKNQKRYFKSWRDTQKEAFVRGHLEFERDQYLIDFVRSTGTNDIFATGQVDYFKKFFTYAEDPSRTYDLVIGILGNEMTPDSLKGQLQALAAKVKPNGLIYVAVNKYMVTRYNSLDPKSEFDNYDEALQDLITSTIGFPILVDAGFNPNEDGSYFNFVHPTTFVVMQNHG